MRDTVQFLNELPPSVPTEQAESFSRRRSTDLDEVVEKDEISFVLSQSPNTRSRLRMEREAQQDDDNEDLKETRCSPIKDYQVR
jgi:hypothetical protein